MNNAGESFCFSARTNFRRFGYWLRVLLAVTPKEFNKYTESSSNCTECFDEKKQWGTTLVSRWRIAALCANIRLDYDALPCLFKYECQISARAIWYIGALFKLPVVATATYQCCFRELHEHRHLQKQQRTPAGRVAPCDLCVRSILIPTFVSSLTLNWRRSVVFRSTFWP